jgi:hypothetical protein
MEDVLKIRRALTAQQRRCTSSSSRRRLLAPSAILVTLLCRVPRELSPTTFTDCLLGSFALLPAVSTEIAVVGEDAALTAVVPANELSWLFQVGGC